MKGMNRYIYLHGFCSSGNSDKVHLLREQTDWPVHAPDIPDKPADAIPFLRAYLERMQHEYPDDELILVGSSLGGYYAGNLGSALGFRMVLINPLVDVADLKPRLGTNHNYQSGQSFELTNEDLDALQALRHETMTGWPILVLLDQGDEVLDYRKAVARYESRARVLQFQGGSHRFDHLVDALQEIEALAHSIAL